MMMVEERAAMQHHDALASAIAGRSLLVRLGAADERLGYCDYNHIYVPSTLSVDQQRQLVIAQALLLRSGSLKPELLSRLLLYRAKAPRYLLAEIVRSARLNAWLLPRSFLQQPALINFSPENPTAEDSLAIALSSESLPATPSYFGELRLLRLLKNALSPFADNGTDTNKPFKQTAAELAEVVEQDRQEIEEGESSQFLDLMANSNIQNGFTQKLFEKMFGAGGGKDPSAAEGASAELEIGRVEAMDKQGRFAKLTNLLGLTGSDKSLAANTAYRYPEWNNANGNYRFDWTYVEEVDPWTDQPLPIKAELVPASSYLIQQLSGIGLDYQWHYGEEQGDELIIDRLVDMRIAQSVGVTPNPRLYRAAKRTQRDLAVMILLDVSGSTAEYSDDTESIHLQQSKLAYELMDGFERVGDQVALYGFHSWGRKQVRLQRVKSFNEQVSNTVLDRFEHLEPSAYTRTGAALRHAAFKLREETQLPHRLLIVISDGFAYDDGYELDYAEADTSRALQTIRADGAACLCLSIGSEQDTTRLKAVFGSATTLSVRNNDEFLVNIRSVILNALADTAVV